MAKPVELATLTGIARRLGTFVAERHPFALDDAVAALEAATGGREPEGPEGSGSDVAIDRLRPAFRRELLRRLRLRSIPGGLGETTPRIDAATRFAQAHEALADDCDGLLRRLAIEASFTPAERIELLRGMILTRATDNRLKTFFASGEVRYGNTAFQGKGFRSLGQEAIYAAAIRLRRGASYRGPDGRWHGDVIGPVIRDLG